MAQIKVDGKNYPSRYDALIEFMQAIEETDGSERERMIFAYYSILGGYTNIDTYKESAQ